MNGSLTRFFGGSPARVLAQLVVLSLIVGIVLSALGLSPYDIVASFQRLIERLWNAGFDTILWAWRYFLLGAVIVFPIWVIMRVVRFGRAGPGGA
jgi:hypothetical protein